MCPGGSYILMKYLVLSSSLLFLCNGSCEHQGEPRSKCLVQQSRLERGGGWQGLRKAEKGLPSLLWVRHPSLSEERRKQ